MKQQEIIINMPIHYRLRQDNRMCSPYPGFWFAHSVNMGTIETEELARLVERNCSLKRSDIMAAMTELTDTIQQLLLDSHRVRIGGIGSLMVGIHGRGAPTAYEFHPGEHILGLHLTFIPDAEFLENYEVKEIPKYDRPGR